jgi:lipid-A-disaccharide synthase
VEASLSFSKQFRLIIAKAPSNEDEFYKSFITDQNIETTRDTYGLLKHARAALVTSGTATLETALFGVPEVVCYKGSNISYQIAKRLIRIKYISLVNLIMDKPVVKELIQDDLTTENLKTELNSILFDTEKILRIKKDYDELRDLLSKGGNASETAAKEIFNLVSLSPHK